ncbi:MAG: NAD-dependent malic enzyme [Chloroflexi bacterium]|nr:NAD-dependent malic enzyme [Chloroflexota bacterium]
MSWKYTSDNQKTEFPTGIHLLHEPSLNKGTAFAEAERRQLGLRGLLPPHVHTQEEQVMRVMENFRNKPTDIEKYIQMISLQDRNETLFYRVVVDYIEQMMPIIYTPTVGLACQTYGHIFQKPRGIFISAKDRGRIIDVLRNWPNQDIRIIVVTDGERILGLGDLGAAGMGIPVGKLSLYTACAGVPPAQCLPVTIDVGTNNESFLLDPLYIGLRQRRLRGAAYDYIVEEFVMAVQEIYPGALIQFEDFGTLNAFRLLSQYKDQVCCFDDDIQGTGAVSLAGIYSALRITGEKLTDQRILFFGAGEAGIGTANLIVSAMVDEGLSLEEARSRCWFFDSKGLVVKGRTDLAAYKLPYAHEHGPVSDFLSAIKAIRPAAIIGASGQHGAFTQPVLEAMAQFHERPIVFSLSNPTAKSECTAEEAYTWTSGRAVFASGSPFAPVTFEGKTFVPGQGNNVYIFPGVGAGVIAYGIKLVTDEMFLTAARTLAAQVSEEDLAQGRIYPSLGRVRDVSAAIAAAVAAVAYDRGLASKPKPDDLLKYIKSQMYEPRYRDYV